MRKVVKWPMKFAWFFKLLRTDFIIENIELKYKTKLKTYIRKYNNQTNKRPVQSNWKNEEDSTECGQRISLDKLQGTIGGWYLLQIYTSIPFTNYSL
jgi:hypothetical protein